MNEESKTTNKDKAPADPKIRMKSFVMDKKIEISVRNSKKEISKKVLAKHNKTAFSPSIAPKMQIKTVQSLPEPKPTSPTTNTAVRSRKSKKVLKSSPPTTNTSPAITKADSMKTARSAPETQSKMVESRSIAKQADSNYNKKEVAVSPTAGKIVKETSSKVAKQQEYKPDHTYYGVPMNMDME